MLRTWKAMSKRTRTEALNGYLGILPWVIGFILFNLGPIIASIYFSLTDWDIISTPEFIGTGNYVKMFTRDPLFWKSLQVTLMYVALSLPMKLVAGLGLSLLLNMKLKGMNFFRTVFYIPAVISGVAVSLIWMWLLQPDYGIVNSLLRFVGIEGPQWFWDPDSALFSVALMSVWSVGGSAIIYLAGLQNIPPHLYEAAKIDGANRWHSFWNITIPLITPTIFFQLVMEMIESFKVFTQAFVITQGGPLKATFFYMLHLYQQAFEEFNMGYASALALFLTLCILVTTVFVNQTSNRWVYYEADVEERVS